MEAILSALVAGAAAVAKDTASDLVKDAYNGLKTMVVSLWKKSNHQAGDEAFKEQYAEQQLENLQSDPDTYKKVVEKELTAAIPEPNAELLALVKKLTDLLAESGQSSGKYSVDVSDAQGVQIGDGNTQNNTFN